MPWNNQTGGQPGNGGRSPWGSGPSGPQPPNLEELLKRGQESLRKALPGGFGRGGAVIAVLVVAVAWLLSGIYFVQADQQGVVLRFGEFTKRTAPGMNYHLPWPIETAMTPRVTRENQLDVGYRTSEDPSIQTSLNVAEESLMLTGDENIVDINFTIFWLIADAADYLFNVENAGDPDAELKDVTIKAVAESAMREVVGRNQIELILTENREVIQEEVRILMQEVLDSYGAGVTVTRVQIQKADPPAQVIDSYRDVQAARTDQDRMRNEAEAYANRIVPEARGMVARILQEAEAYKQQSIAEADGEAQRFNSIYQEFVKAPDVTRRRIYLETMEGIFADMDKVIIDSQGGQGVVPYLPLPAIQQRQNQGAQRPPNVAVTAGNGGGQP